MYMKFKITDDCSFVVVFEPNEWEYAIEFLESIDPSRDEDEDEINRIIYAYNEIMKPKVIN